MEPKEHLMTSAELEGFKQQLLHLGRRMQGDFAALSSETLHEAGGAASGNLSNTPVHMADLGTDHFEQEMTLNLMETEGQTLEEISAALERIRTGTFGRCESCGNDIARERLQALPYTSLCINCARQQDKGPPATDL
jgi:RNA polymerase-binding protein DksA